MSKTTILRKTSTLLAVLLFVSMLVPVLASAAVRFTGTFQSNGTVSGQVYFDDEGDRVGQAVYARNKGDVQLAVYGNDGTFIDVITVTYASYQDGKSYYQLPAGLVLSSVYDSVYFKYDDGHISSVSNVVYRDKPNPPGGCTYCGGGGWIPTPTDGSTIDAVNGTVDAYVLKTALEKYTEVTIKVTGDTVSIPASALVDAKAGSILHIVTDHGSYSLPLDALDLDALAQATGSDVDDLKIVVEIKKLTGSEADAVTDAIEAIGGKALADAVDFRITAVGKDGKEAAIDTFDRYVKRKIPLNEKPSKTATAVLYDPDTKALSFVPGLVSDTEAVFWRTGNSVYTVIERSKTFDDIDTHWAQSYIEQLASKLIIDGVTDTAFQPDRNITRAEFAALVVRSLGLTSVTGSTYFDDVDSSDWFDGVVGAAAKAGIVDGYEDGTFRPNAQITREELAAMVVRAYEYAGGEVSLSSSEVKQVLSKWSDADRIVWGHEEVAKAVAAGLMDGMTTTTLETYGQATRAQTAAMLKRYLSEVNFID